jgi:DNA-binding CsgD family transcriptional regulator
MHPSINTVERSVPGRDAVIRKFDLTRSEARLACALINTGHLNTAAAMCSITVGTARQYLKLAFRKTGTNSQVGLVVLLMSPLQMGQYDGSVS